MHHFLFAIAAAFAFGAPVVRADDSQLLDLKAEEVVPDLNTFRIANAPAAPYMLTGIPKKNIKTGVVSFLAASPINPVVAPETPASRDVFAQVERRPLTWPEANAACATYRVAGKDWRLPSIHELKQLNEILDFKANVLDSEDPRAQTLKASLKDLDGMFMDQYQFFWSETVDSNIGRGQKLAGFFGPKGKFQGMSEARPLSTICVTYFSGPERPRDRIAAGEAVRKGG